MHTEFDWTADCSILASNLTRMLAKATRHVRPGGVFRMSAPMKELAGEVVG